MPAGGCATQARSAVLDRAGSSNVPEVSRAGHHFFTGSPDRLLDEFPSECADCGSVLLRNSAGFALRQCHDIPPISVQVTETRWHRVRCGCGQVTTAKPDGLPDCPYYGPQLATLAVYLLVYQYVPVKRAAVLIRDVTGAAPSTGWIASQLVKAAGLVDAPNKLIMALLVLAAVLHADETATNVAGKKSWPHVACTDTLTLWRVRPGPRDRPHPTRAAAPLEDLLQLRDPGRPGPSPGEPTVRQAEHRDEPAAAPARLQGPVPALHHDLAVPATNNAAERNLRPIKTQLKVSGCHASAIGARNWIAVRSYIVTAIKHGLGAFDVIRQAINGQAWMPRSHSPCDQLPRIRLTTLILPECVRHLGM